MQLAGGRFRLLLGGRRHDGDAVRHVRPVQVGLGEPGLGGIDPGGGAHVADIDAVHPVELLLVEDGVLLRDAIEREGAAELRRRDDGSLAVERPAEQRQEVHESVGQIPPVAVFLHIGGAVALRELLAVGAQDHGQVREQRHLGAERLVDEHLARGVGEMVVAADDVGDGHVHVVADHSEVVGERAVGAAQDHVVHHIDGEAHVAVDGILERDRTVVVGHFQAPDMGLAGSDARGGLVGRNGATGAVVARVTPLGFLGGLALGVQLLLGAEARVGGAGVDELLQRCLVRVGALGLEVGAARSAHLRALVPIEAHPRQRAQNDLGVLLGGTLRVGVLDAQHEGASGSPGEGPVVDGGASAADVQLAGGRRREADAHGLGRGHGFPSVLGVDSGNSASIARGLSHHSLTTSDSATVRYRARVRSATEP